MRLLNTALAVVLMLAAGPALVDAQITSAGQLVPRMASGLDVTLTGEVLATFDNELVLLRDESGAAALIDLQEKHWELGLQPGNQIVVKGKTVAADPKPEVKAEDITVTSKRTRDVGRAYGKLVDLLDAKRVGDPIAILGTITSTPGRYVDLSDGTYTVAADMIDADYAVKYVASNEPMIFVGVLAERLEGVERSRAVQIVSIKPLGVYKRRGDDLPVTPMEDLIGERRVGSFVRTTGRLIHYIGEESLPVLIEDEHVAVLRLGKKYESLPVRAGSTVSVVGVVDFEQHKGEEYLVLRDARIIP